MISESHRRFMPAVLNVLGPYFCLNPALSGDSDTPQNIHFNVFVAVMFFIHCKNNIWIAKSKRITPDVEQKLLFPTPLIKLNSLGRSDAGLYPGFRF